MQFKKIFILTITSDIMKERIPNKHIFFQTAWFYQLIYIWSKQEILTLPIQKHMRTRKKLDFTKKAKMYGIFQTTWLYEFIDVWKKTEELDLTNSERSEKTRKKTRLYQLIKSHPDPPPGSAEVAESLIRQD